MFLLKDQLIHDTYRRRGKDMRFATAEYQDSIFIGMIDDSYKYIIHINNVLQELGRNAIPSTLLECIAYEEAFLDEIELVKSWLVSHAPNQHMKISLGNVKLLAPIPRPTKNIFCVGKNYAEHAIEMGSVADIPTDPIFFSKAPTTVIGPDTSIDSHQYITNSLDYEGELAVIIGKAGKSISVDDAMSHVFGYTILNDITARDLQEKHKQYLVGKSLDGSCPMGPFIAHHSLIPDPHNLTIQTKVNEEIRQSAVTDQLIFNIPTLISVLSQGMTLETGDIIATGTPSGVGKGFKPPKFLKPGDKIEIMIDHLHVLRNHVE